MDQRKGDTPVREAAKRKDMCWEEEEETERRDTKETHKNCEMSRNGATKWYKEQRGRGGETGGEGDRQGVGEADSPGSHLYLLCSDAAAACPSLSRLHAALCPIPDPGRTRTGADTNNTHPPPADQHTRKRQQHTHSSFCVTPGVRHLFSPPLSISASDYHILHLFQTISRLSRQCTRRERKTTAVLKHTHTRTPTHTPSSFLPAC